MIFFLNIVIGSTKPSRYTQAAPTSATQADNIRMMGGRERQKITKTTTEEPAHINEPKQLGSHCQQQQKHQQQTIGSDNQPLSAPTKTSNISNNMTATNPATKQRDNELVGTASARPPRQ